MKRLGEILLGVVLVLLAISHERRANHATRMESKMLDGLRSGGHHRTHQHSTFVEGMMKYWRYLWNTLLTLIVAGWIWTITSCTAHAQKYPVKIDSMVQNNMDFILHTIQEKAGLESVYCVLGFLRNDTLNLTAVTLAWMDSAGQASAYPRHYCITRVTVGIIHTHPDLGGMYECSPSATDEATLLRSSFSVNFIACRKRDKTVEIVSYWKEDINPEITVVRNAAVGHWRVTYRYKRPP